MVKYYEIRFNATNTKGEVVHEIQFTAGPFYPENKPLSSKSLALQRFCVEYARLIGVSCSFAEICSICEVK